MFHAAPCWPAPLLPLFAITAAREPRISAFKLANNSPVTHPAIGPPCRRPPTASSRPPAAQSKSRCFPTTSSASDTDMLSQLRSGAIDFFTLSGLILATLVPAASINGIGFAFKDYDRSGRRWTASSAPMCAARSTSAASIAMDKIWDNGFRQITSSTQPIKTPADLKGFKIRVPVSPLWTCMFQALGASPISINFSEVYSALQTKIAEGQENPLSLIQIAKLYEVQKYCLA